MPRLQRKLHPVEFLEARVLLAGTELPDQGSALAMVDAAILENGAQVVVELLPFNEVLKITGTGKGSISIDLQHLPPSIVSLQVSSFDSVTLLGESTMRDLVITEVRFADAGKVSLERLFTYGVEHVRIATAPDEVMLQGAGGHGIVGGRTLFEAGRFSSAPQAYIFVAVESLGLASSSHVEALPPISGQVTNSILLNFQPDRPITTSHEGTVSVIRGGDFVRYYLSSPDERANLEQLLLIARQAAKVNLVPLSDLLKNPALQSALSSGPETGFTLARHGEGPLVDGTFAGLRLDPEFGPFLGTELLSEDSLLEWSESAAEEANPALLALESGVLPLAFPDHGTPASDSSAPGISGDEAAFALVDPSRLPPAEPGDFAGAAALAVARLGEPLAQMVFDFHGRFATFGDMATARLAENLRSDSRPALLVDARPARQRDGVEVVSV